MSERIGSIAKGHRVLGDTNDIGLVTFAKDFIAAHKGGWRAPHTKTLRTNALDARKEEAFRVEYASKNIRHGFGGSGETEYTSRLTGATFRVHVTSASGDFWASDYWVSRIERKARKAKPVDLNALNAKRQREQRRSQGLR